MKFAIQLYDILKVKQLREKM